MVRRVTIRKRRVDGVKQRYHINPWGKIKRAGSKKRLRIVVGGPPHSGKSTFMTLLYRDLYDKGVDVALFDTDYASPTVDWILGGKRGSKQPWSPELAWEAYNDFVKESQRHDITLGDAPGKITQITAIICNHADGAIILSRDPNEISKWRRFFNSMKIPVIAIVDSRLKGFNIYSHHFDRGRATKLNRDDLRAGRIDDDNIVIESISHEIGEKMGIDLRSEMPHTWGKK